MSSNISNFLDKQGKIKVWPSKKEMKLKVLKYLAGKFESGRFYREKEINSIINDWHIFNDYFLLRRGLIDSGFLSRTRDGAKYWREERITLNEMERIILDDNNIAKINSI